MKDRFEDGQKGPELRNERNAALDTEKGREASAAPRSAEEHDPIDTSILI